MNRKRSNPKKIPAHLYASTRMKYEAIQTCSREHSVRKMCSVLGLRAANYYRWNFNAWAAALKHDLPEDDMSGILQRMLTEKRYEEIDAMMQKREEENMELLKQYHII